MTNDKTKAILIGLAIAALLVFVLPLLSFLLHLTFKLVLFAALAAGIAYVVLKARGALRQ